MNYKPFDLQKALAGEPVVTNEGVPANYKFTAVNDLIEHHHVFTYIDNKGREWVTVVNDEGMASDGFSLIRKSAKLFMAPVKKTVWVNMYKSFPAGSFWLGRTTTYESEQAAREVPGYKSSDYIGTYPIEIEL